MKRLIKRAITACVAMCMLILSVPVSADAAWKEVTYSAFAGGTSHSLAVSKEGGVYVWGSNESNQLGLGENVAEAQTPTLLASLKDIVMVTAGDYFSAALDNKGQVYIWGGSALEEPTSISALDDILTISAGQSALLAVKKDGTVWSWTQSGGVKQVQGLTNAVAVSCGAVHYLALTADGFVYAWGDNSYGQLGNGTTQSASSPQKVSQIYNVVSIAAGSNHSMAVLDTGELYAWGANNYGQLGNGDTASEYTPIEIESIKNPTSISAGCDYSMAVVDQKLYAWGYGEYGQIGNNKTVSVTTAPTEISFPGTKTIAHIACGSYHSMAITTTGRLYVWGRNKSYQIGNGNNDNVSTPQFALDKIAGQTENTDAQSIVYAGMSDWALGEAETLEARGLLSPVMWGEYQNGIERGKFIHALISIYEAVKGGVEASKTQEYSDIEGHMFESDIRKALTLGLINGTSDTEMSPDGSLTREQAAKIISTFLEKMVNATIMLNKKDVSFFTDSNNISAWAAVYINFVYENSIMIGDDQGRFNPKAVLTQEQSIILLSRLAADYNWGA